MTVRFRRGFTLIEVLAALAIAMLLIVPIARIVTGTAGSFAGLNRSADRRADMQAAIAVATALEPLHPGRRQVGRFTVLVAPYNFQRKAELARAGWQLYSITVRSKASADEVVMQTVRLGKLQ